MLQLRGPRAILSSAIANALSEYFVVDADAIESTLTGNANIILHNVKLKDKPAVIAIPINGDGKSTAVTALTGSVETVEFAWTWSNWSSSTDDSWVNNAILTIKGAKFEARLEHVDINKKEDETIETTANDVGGSFIDPSRIDSASAKHIEAQTGGLSGYIERQVKMIIDTLTLKLVDFNFRIVLPKPMHELNYQSSVKDGVEVYDAYNMVLTIGGKEIEVLSFGREGQEGEVIDLMIKLKQRVNILDFFCNITDDDDGIITHPFLEKFSYSADIERLGERFGGILTGLEFIGHAAQDSPSDMSVHVGHVQLETLMQLGVMLLSAPDDSAASSVEIPIETPKTEQLSAVSEPSSFTISISSISLVLYEEIRVNVSDVVMNYTADGKITIQANKFKFKSGINGQIEATGLVLSILPVMRMTIGSIDSAVITDTAILLSPIQHCEVIYEGNTISLHLNSIAIMTYAAKDTAEDGVAVSVPILPCNINITIEEDIHIKSEDGAVTELGRFHLYALKEERCTKVAFQLQRYKNNVVSLSTLSLCATFPLNQLNIIADLIFTAGEINVMSGHDTEEWTEAFRPIMERIGIMERKLETMKLENSSSRKIFLESERKKKVDKPKDNLIKLPFASIGDLKITVSVEASLKIGKIKDTSFIVKAYKGNSGTTTKDLINYYVKACLARAPAFIRNVELLGLNVLDTASGLSATYAGAGSLAAVFGSTLGSALGAGAGVVVVTGFDAIKGAVDAGKRARKADEDEASRPTDFFMGLVQAAKESTRDGASKRGKLHGEGNVFDWTVGATVNTTEYVKKEKNKLGAAGAGGGGFLIGMAVGGPIGAVVGGLLASATTGAALKTIDRKVGNKTETIDE